MTLRAVAVAALLVVAACGDDGGGTTPDGGSDGCATNADCSDGIFCNGTEMCAPMNAAADANGCIPGSDPCPDAIGCNEASMRCIDECSDMSDADEDGVDSIMCGGTDCDDGDPNRFPGNTEICDGANVDEDCDPTTFGFRDQDMDGSPDAACCNEDADGELSCGFDCDDLRPGVNPDEAESCDGRDNDCDGMVDEEVLTTYVEDADGDNFGSMAPEAAVMMACSRPTGFADNATDCDDTTSAINPGNPEVCDAAMVDENCDGVANPAEECSCTTGESRLCTLPGECSGSNQECVGGTWGACSISPVTEVCNGLNDDCDGQTDEGLTVLCFDDEDRDGFAATGTMEAAQCPDSARPEFGGCPLGTTNLAPLSDDIDCDDTRSAVRPGQTETCDFVDQDCDGMVDEGASITCYTDTDGDSYAPSAATAMAACPVAGREFVGGCPVGLTNRDPASSADCNDMASGVNPGATEICDAGRVDEDCDGTPNQAAVCECDNGMTRNCSEDGAMGVCAGGIQNCADGAWGACSISASTEICNGADDNCNGMTDEGVTVTCYEDLDDDTFPAMGATAQVVCPASGRGAVGGCPFQLTNRVPSVSTEDCNDGNASINPDGTEICDPGMNDEDCDGSANTMCTCTGSEVRNCPPPGSRCADGTQTCSGGAWGTCTISPIAETCNGEDDDCDGVVDNGVTVVCYTDDDNDTYPDPAASMQIQCPDLGRPSFGNCPTGFTNVAPSATTNDCDETNDTINPGATEICDQARVDTDCDGDPDPTPPCFCLNGTSRSCADGGALGVCATGSQLCTDGAWGTCSISPSTDVCNGLDDNCDGTVDEFVTTTCWDDPDNDTYAAVGAATTQVCGGCGTGSTSREPVGGGIDCIESDPNSYPGATELCDRIDNDCSTGGGVVAAEDADEDGHTRVGFSGCFGGFAKDDCHDGNDQVYGGNSRPQTAGYCPPDYPCSCTSGCTTPVIGICQACVGAGMVPKSFDYDCDGSETREESNECTCCPAGEVCSSLSLRCRGSGVQYTGTPACGSFVDNISCSGSFGSLCWSTCMESSAGTVRLGCY